MLNMRNAAIAATLVCSLPTQSLAQTAYSADCWRPDEARAARLQNLQMALMIDAIKCQDTMPTTLASYNDFMSQRRDLIVANKYGVQAHFVRTLGSVDGAKGSTDYDTRTGNTLSSAPIDVDRCEAAGVYARLATHAPEDDLVALSDMLVKTPGFAECAATATVSTKPKAMIIPVWRKPETAATEPVTVQPAVVAANPADVVVASSTPVGASDSPIATAVPAAVPAQTATATQLAPVAASQTITAVATSPAAVATPNGGAASGDDTLKALQLAVAALNQVAVKLQANAKPPAIDHEQ